MEFQVDTRDVSRAVDALKGMEHAAERAMRRALTRSVKSSKGEAARAISERYAVKSSAVKRTLSSGVYERSGEMVARLSSRGEPLSMRHFPHSPKRPGTGGKGGSTVRVQIFRGQWKPLKGAFIAPLSGTAHVVRRATENRLPIEKVPSVPIPVMLKAVSSQVRDYALKVYERRLSHEVARELEKASG